MPLLFLGGRRMITPKILEIIHKGQAEIVEFKLEQFESGTEGYFLSVRRDNLHYDVCIVSRTDLEQWFQAMKSDY